MSDWTEDAKAARAEACIQPQARGAPPHWARCEFFNKHGKRCTKSDRHLGDHEPPK